MITLQKASAGSGKTHSLASKYINMLLKSKDKDEYRHILAVTFTNKATDEMKQRIVENLFNSDDPKAKECLYSILHDYGSFNVSTIDKFFQSTLRAFAREIGQFNNWRVELDKNALTDEAVDTILDELQSDNPQDRHFIDFLVEQLQEQVSEGKRLNIEDELKEMARQLKSSSFSQKCRESGMDLQKAYSPENLKAMKSDCIKVIKAYEEGIRERAAAVIKAMDAAGLCEDDFSRKWISFVRSKFLDWKHGDKLEITDSVYGKIKQASAENWFTKKNQSLFEQAYAIVGQALEDLADYLVSSEVREYNTACILLKQVYGLSVAQRLFTAFERVIHEKNVICLDDSTTLLKDIIDGSDAPFVYEKTGVMLRNFLLDEFQDTSVTQWQNFLPLLGESQSKKLPDKQGDHIFDDLIVGDVKQSIYRWRESDWSLLDQEVDNAFPGNVHHDALELNWRSRKEIVEFNNKLYPALAAYMDSMLATGTSVNKVSRIYAGCEQQPARPKEQDGGFVQLAFFDERSAELDDLLATIRCLHDEHKVPYSEIAVLVRKNSLGTLVAGHLIDNGIDVVTESSLNLKSSVSVRRIVSLMSMAGNGEDKLRSFVAKSYGAAELDKAYHGLVGLAESMYGILHDNPQCREDCDKESIYIASFMDFVLDYSSNNGNNLKEFLKHWEESSPSVNSSQANNAVIISTIHKSKGLAFSYVIVPFLDELVLADKTRNSLWLQPSKSGGLLDAYSNALYHVCVNDNAVNSNFHDSCVQELFNEALDAINLMYVATTRAKYGMKLSSTIKKNLTYNNIGELLYKFSGGKDTLWGSVEDYVAKEEEKSLEQLPLNFAHYDIGERLMVRPYAADFFTREGEGLSSLNFRERGMVYHDILSRVEYPDELDKAVATSVAQGLISAGEAKAVQDFLGRRIASHSEFFPERSSGTRVMMEQTLIAPDGTMHRPDRIIMGADGSVVIVDFKFGTFRPEYDRQVEEYRELFLNMGYTCVKAHLWFVYQNKLQ